jgi:hypothetical protein
METIEDSACALQTSRGGAAQRYYMRVPLLAHSHKRELYGGGGLRFRHMLFMPNTSGHVAAGLGATSADLGAVEHHLVAVRKTLTIIGAPVADVGAHIADLSVQVRFAEHEISTGLTNLRAVEQQGDVLRRRVSSSLLQTVRNCHEADVVTLRHDFYIWIVLVSHIALLFINLFTGAISMPHGQKQTLD